MNYAQQRGTSACLLCTTPEGGVRESLAATIQEEEAAVVSFCVHWPIFHRLSYLDQRKVPLLPEPSLEEGFASSHGSEPSGSLMWGKKSSLLR